MIKRNNRHSVGESQKVLVTYFSYSGNTREIANQIHQQIGGDIFEIQSASEYPASYNDVLARAKQEILAGVKPVLRNQIATLDDYKIIFIGYPNWWNTFPAPVLTFLSEYDFTNKTIVPFCTHGGGGTGRSINDIALQCPGATVLDGFSINGYSVGKNNREVAAWISKLKNLIPQNIN
uniref:flavodoxin n=1 Tax=uncultured Draconibacterium sp. TaxID=1573823 RepID=UPI003217C41C